jgi:ATP-dependent HslUV protease ATP-binding subunit HslU
MNSREALTPKEIVVELDRFIIGQNQAKRAVAVALRNRWRRRNVPEGLRNEIMPKNILMIGSTGIGKTEIARRLAKLANAPFIKVEATKFTEVGYVGRDVDSIIRDLVEVSVHMVRNQMRQEVAEKAKANVEERILDLLVGDIASEETREKFRKMLAAGELQDKEIEVKITESGAPLFPTFEVPGGQMGVINIGDMIQKALGGSSARQKTKKLTVADAYEALTDEEEEKLLDEESIVREAIDLVENEGIVFLDEVDKIAVRHESRGGGEVSREGVQRDLLPLIEGCSVATKYGTVKTDYILFIASGAFYSAKPSDLLPELQGRLPIRVELKPLSKDDLIKILLEPEASLLKQYIGLLATESVELEFLPEAVEEIAELATEINRDVENIGARRLHTIMEKLLEEISFAAADYQESTKIVVDKQYVQKHVGELLKQSDLSKFIL